MSGLIARRISSHLEEHSSLPAEQNGCHSGSKGSKDQLPVTDLHLEPRLRMREPNLHSPICLHDMVLG